jgi:hypothetical protein
VRSRTPRNRCWLRARILKSTSRDFQETERGGALRTTNQNERGSTRAQPCHGKTALASPRAGNCCVLVRGLTASVHLVEQHNAIYLSLPVCDSSRHISNCGLCSLSLILSSAKALITAQALRHRFAGGGCPRAELVHAVCTTPIVGIRCV